MYAQKIHSMENSQIGLIAGSGELPIAFINEAKAKGIEVYVIAHKGETDEVINSLAKEVKWINVGQFKKVINFFKKHGIKQTAITGGINRARLFGKNGIRPDWLALKLAAQLKSLRDNLLLPGIANLIESYEIEVVSPGLILEDYIPSAGLLTKRNLSDQEKADVEVAWEACRATGDLDIGQSVIAFEGVVTAVEAVEGTDKAIERAGDVTGKRGGVLVKLCKRGQDLRVDLPTIGLKTIETMKDAGLTALVIEDKKALVIDPEEVIRLANEYDIAVVVKG